MYSNVSNVLVRVYPSTPHDYDREGRPQGGGCVPPTARSILVNAHLDSVSTSPGASDDALGCALMLATLRALLVSQHPPDYITPLIFLFNGAEELHQLGSHGFMATHTWAASVRYLVNLESIGGGGRELVFQCNSAALIRLYAKAAPYARGSVVAHELFGAVLWRHAATDWRSILQAGTDLRDRNSNTSGAVVEAGAAILGLDTAYIANGHVYHTPQDTEAVISDGTIVNSLVNLESFLSGLRALDTDILGTRSPHTVHT